MFHEAYHVTIENSRLVKSLQAFEESADWVLLTGVARGDAVSLQTSGISFHFVLREVLCQTKYRSSLKVKIFSTFKNLGWLRHWLCFLHFAMIQTCRYSNN